MRKKLKSWHWEPGAADGSRRDTNRKYWKLTGSKNKMEGNKQEVKETNRKSWEGTKKEQILSCVTWSNIYFYFYQTISVRKMNHHIYTCLILPTTRGHPHCRTLVCVLSPIISCLILFWKVRNISSVFISRVKMHSTRYDLSPRRCPLPWCLRRSGPCWSSIAPQGQQDNRTPWSCLISDSTVSSGPAGGDVCDQTSLWMDFFYTWLFFVWISSWEFWWCFPVTLLFNVNKI